jgi:hypothetical protein
VTLADAVRGKRVAVVGPVDPPEDLDREVLIRVNVKNIRGRTDLVYHHCCTDATAAKAKRAAKHPIVFGDWSARRMLMASHPHYFGDRSDGTLYPHAGTCCVYECLEAGAADVYLAGMDFYAGADPVWRFTAREYHDARMDLRWTRETATEGRISMDPKVRRIVGGMSFDDVVAAIRSRRSFALARYGDGEFRCMRGDSGMNCDGHAYSMDLGEALGDGLKRLTIGVMPFSLMGDFAERCCRDSGEPMIDFSRNVLGDKPYGDGWIFHRASESGRLGRFFEALRERQTILVGPERFGKLAPWIDVSAHVRIPDRNCWEATRETLDGIGALIRAMPGAVVLFAAGMAAKPWIDSLFETGATLVDIGSVLDPYTGVDSREYMRRRKVRFADPVWSEADGC